MGGCNGDGNAGKDGYSLGESFLISYLVCQRVEVVSKGCLRWGSWGRMLVGAEVLTEVCYLASGC